jgi:hypothetical protein
MAVKSALSGLLIQIAELGAGAWKLVESKMPGRPLEVGDGLGARSAVGRAQPNVHSSVRLETKRTGPPGHPDDQKPRAVQDDGLDVRQQGGADSIRDSTGQALLRMLDVGEAVKASVVGAAGNQGTARSVGEGGQSLEHGCQGGQVALELQGLALRLGQQIPKILLGVRRGVGSAEEPDEGSRFSLPFFEVHLLEVSHRHTALPGRIVFVWNGSYPILG